MNLKVDAFKRETFDSALSLGVDALKILGNDSMQSERAGELFSQYDNGSLTALAELWGDDHSYGVAVKQRVEDLKQVLQKDKIAQAKLKVCNDSTDDC